MALGFWQDKVRPALEKHPAIALGIVGAGVLVAGIVGIRSWIDPTPPLIAQPAYYTCDDGKTIFEDEQPRLPPFDHDGHEAVRAYIIPGRTAGPDSIWYLTKWTDEGKKKMEANVADGPPQSPPQGAQLVKRPGDATWIPANDPQSAAIIAFPK